MAPGGFPAGMEGEDREALLLLLFCGRDIIPEVPRAGPTSLIQKHLGLKACLSVAHPTYTRTMLAGTARLVAKFQSFQDT